MHISNKCNWQQHIKHVASKGNQMLRFIKRNFKGCPPAVKETVYVSLVRPLLEYASGAWDPGGEVMKQELERVQRRAARFVLDDYSRNSSVNDMLSKLGWDVLETRRKIARLALMFSMYRGNSRADVSNIMLAPCFVGRNDHCKKIRRLQSRILPYHNSFFPKTIREWNGLPTDVIEAENVNIFKKMLRCSQQF